MNPEDELFLLRWNHIKLPSSVLQLPAGVGARDILWVMSASSYAALVTTPRRRAHQSARRRFNSFFMPAAKKKKKTWRRERGDMITLSAGGAKKLREYLQLRARAQAKWRTPSNQGQLATSLIITLLTLPAGIQNATPLLRWCDRNENEEHLDGSRVPDPFVGVVGGAMKAWWWMIDGCSEVFHCQRCKVNGSVSPTWARWL